MKKTNLFKVLPNNFLTFCFFTVTFLLFFNQNMVNNTLTGKLRNLMSSVSRTSFRFVTSSRVVTTSKGSSSDNEDLENGNRPIQGDPLIPETLRNILIKAENRVEDKEVLLNLVRTTREGTLEKIRVETEIDRSYFLSKFKDVYAQNIHLIAQNIHLSAQNIHLIEGPSDFSKINDPQFKEPEELKKRVIESLWVNVGNRCLNNFYLALMVLLSPLSFFSRYFKFFEIDKILSKANQFYIVTLTSYIFFNIVFGSFFNIISHLFLENNVISFIILGLIQFGYCFYVYSNFIPSFLLHILVNNKVKNPHYELYLKTMSKPYKGCLAFLVNVLIMVSIGLIPKLFMCFLIPCTVLTIATVISNPVFYFVTVGSTMDKVNFSVITKYNMQEDTLYDNIEDLEQTFNAYFNNSRMSSKVLESLCTKIEIHGISKRAFSHLIRKLGDIRVKWTLNQPMNVKKELEIIKTVQVYLNSFVKDSGLEEVNYVFSSRSIYETEVDGSCKNLLLDLDKSLNGETTGEGTNTDGMFEDRYKLTRISSPTSGALGHFHQYLSKKCFKTRRSKSPLLETMVYIYYLLFNVNISTIGSSDSSIGRKFTYQDEKTLKEQYNELIKGPQQSTRYWLKEEDNFSKKGILGNTERTESRSAETEVPPASPTPQATTVGLPLVESIPEKTKLEQLVDQYNRDNSTIMNDPNSVSKWFSQNYPEDYEKMKNQDERLCHATLNSFGGKKGRGRTDDLIVTHAFSLLRGNINEGGSQAGSSKRSSKMSGGMSEASSSGASKKDIRDKIKRIDLRTLQSQGIIPPVGDTIEEKIHCVLVSMAYLKEISKDNGQIDQLLTSQSTAKIIEE